jgi:hypothetical protein
MEDARQSEFRPEPELLNAAGGDVAICTLVTEPGWIAPAVDRDRVGFVAPLRTRSDLEWLLRTLALHPRIRHLVVCGDDLRSTGAALLALWEQGLGSDGRLPDSRGWLAPDLDPESLDAIRRHVGILDWRDKAPARVASDLLALPALPGANPPRPVANVEPPERTVFLSRKTSFPIFSGDAGDAWLQLLNLVLRIGTEKRTSAGERRAEALNAVVTIELPDDAGEFPAFLDFNADDFERYYRRFTSPAASEDAGPPGGERPFGSSGIAQLRAAIERLQRSHDARVGTPVLLEPGDLDTPDTAPSLVSASFNVTDGWPREALSLVRLQREVAERLDIGAGTATFVIHEAHVDARDWDRALRVLREAFRRPLPLQVDPSGIFLFGNDGGKARAMLLDHGANEIFWEEAFSDPEDLSWYIVDVMPWLLPQHVRYVGQECASLMRAIRECECYEQG